MTQARVNVDNRGGMIPGKPGVRVTALRAYSFTASLFPLAISVTYGIHKGVSISYAILACVVIGVVAIHAASNITNDIEDFRNGLDNTKNPGTHGILARGLLTATQLQIQAYVLFGVGLAAGAVVAWHAGWQLLVLGLIGMAGGYWYTAGPVALKYKGMGDLLMFVIFGPLIAVGTGYALFGYVGWDLVLLSVPAGILVSTMLHGNNTRDFVPDKSRGVTTLAIRLGFTSSQHLLAVLMAVPYGIVGVLVLTGILSLWGLLVFVSVPMAMAIVVSGYRAQFDDVSPIRTIDKRVAALQGVFGVFYLAGIMV